MAAIILEPQGTSLAINNIFCIGRNYRAHAEELGQRVEEAPVVFLKPTSAVILQGQPILLPPLSQKVHHEVEVVVALGRGGRDIPEERALETVAAYGLGLDLTLRDVQERLKRQGLPWTIAKGFDTSAPLSAFLPAERIPDPQDIHFTLAANGALRQRGHTKEMIFPIPSLIAYLSTLFTLHRGDLLFTGTPQGVGPIQPGDLLRLEMDGLLQAEFIVGDRSL